MMPPALNPFGLGAPPPQSLSRDNMPLPYGEHHLMQVIYQHKLRRVTGPMLHTDEKGFNIRLQCRPRTLPWRHTTQFAFSKG